MDDQTYNKIVSFIWGIADDCLPTYMCVANIERYPSHDGY